MTISDETLSAFIDGELSDTQMAAIETQIASDPALAQRVASLRSVDTALAGVLADAASEPLPDHILDMVSAYGRDADNNVVAFRKVAPRNWFQSPLAMAAAAAFGIAVGVLLAPAQGVSGSQQIFAGSVSSDSALFSVLETVPSNQRQYGFTPQVSFASTSGGVCREVVSAEARALACRENGDWTVLAVTHEVQSRSNQTYQTASANASIVFDILAEELMQETPMSAQQERILIEQNWSDTAKDLE